MKINKDFSEVVELFSLGVGKSYIYEGKTYRIFDVKIPYKCYCFEDNKVLIINHNQYVKVVGLELNVEIM